MKRFFKIFFIIFCCFLVLSFFGGVARFFIQDTDYKKGNIAVIEVEGIITESMSVLEQIQEAQKNAHYKAVVVRINSPGGSVGSSQEIFLELKKLKQKKPVIISMGDIAASGGLYVALGGSTIFALPGTLTGSMGVLLQLTNFSRLLDKIYVDPLTIRSGELKDAGNPIRPVDPHAKKFFEELIQRTFKMFQQAVAQERKLKKEVVQYLSDGRVIEGIQALEFGLVDALGTFQDAVQKAGEMAKIKEEVDLAWLSRKPKGWMSQFFEQVTTPLEKVIKSYSGSFLQYRLEPSL